MRRPLVLAAGILVVATGAPSAHAAAIQVTIADDVRAADGRCSLREAIDVANADTAEFPDAGECPAGEGGDTIVLPAGTFKLAIAGAKEGANATGDLDVLSTATITGAGAASTTIDADGKDRALDVIDGVTLTVRSVTIKGGHAPDGAPGTAVIGADSDGGFPGGFAHGVNGGPGEPGGGLRSAGTLVLSDAVITGNRAGDGGAGGPGTGGSANGTVGGDGGDGLGGSGGSGGDGGGIWSNGDATLTGVTLADNHAGVGGASADGTGGRGGLSAASNGGDGGDGRGGFGGAGGRGGGMWVEGSDLNTTIDLSSIRSNSAGDGGRGGDGTSGAGGGSLGSGGVSGGKGGLAQGGTAGSGGFGGGIGTLNSTLTATRVLVDGNVAGNGADSGNATADHGGGVSGGTGTNQGGAGGNATAFGGGSGGSGGGLIAGAGSMSDITVTANHSGDGGTTGAATSGAGGIVISGNAGAGGNANTFDGGDGGAGAGMVAVSSVIGHATITRNVLGGAGGSGIATVASGGIATSGAGGEQNVGGGIYGLAVTLRNSVVTSNTAPACGTAGADGITDGGFDVSFGDATCPGTNADPLLGSLADNGGPTLTQRPTTDSPLRDAIPASGANCSATDQRGVARPNGAGCEIGAYEVAPPAASTDDATDVAGSGAMLRGTVTPNAAATYHFDYGPTAAYGSSTPDTTLPGGPTASQVSAAVGGLAAATTYHVRIVATNLDGTSTGADRTFTTSGGDSTAPVFLSASLKPKTFAVNRKGASEKVVAAKAKRGTTFRYRLSEPARVVFTIQRAAKGRRVGKACRKPTRANRTKRACTRYVQAKRFAKQSKTAANTKKFSGRIGKRALRPGRYRAALVATDTAGNRSKGKRLTFRIVR